MVGRTGTLVDELSIRDNDRWDFVLLEGDQNKLRDLPLAFGDEAVPIEPRRPILAAPLL
jgi:hypothetical protein